MAVDGSVVVAVSGGHVITGLARGYVHPEEAIIAEPYRTPSCRRASLHNWERLFLPCIQRTAPLVWIGRVVAVYEPWKLFEASMRRLPPEILELVAALEPDRVGLTGSYAIGCESPDRSDVDLVVYTSDPEALAERLRRLRLEGLVRQCALGRVASKRRGRGDYSASPEHIGRSIVESCYRGVPYTLRILRKPRPETCVWSAPLRSYAGKASIVARLSPEGADPLMVPARYGAAVERVLEGPLIPGDRLVLESFRTRYADLAAGRYLVRGELFEERGVWVLSPDLWGGVWRV